MKQYWDLKSRAEGALLLFRMGDFYELFGDDAVEASKLLEITLTSRDKGKANPMPMAGVPHHSVQGYIQKLLKAGRKVAIGEQLEDPANLPKGVKIVPRDVTRIFTPAVQFDAQGSEAAYLATAIAGPEGWSLACLDAATGEALVGGPLSEEAAASELERLPVRHWLRLGGRAPFEPRGILVEDLPANYLSATRAREILASHNDVADLSAFVPGEQAAHALGLLVAYAARTQKLERLAHLRVPAPLRKPTTLELGPRTAQHLDLIGTEGPTLLALIDRTRSALGARAFRRWLLAPLKDPREIAARQAAVRELASGPPRANAILGEIYDLERIVGRLSAKLANPRDTLALGRSIAAIPGLRSALGKAETPGLAELSRTLERLSERLSPLGARIVATQRDDAPLTHRDGGIFARGTDPALDRLLTLADDGSRFLVELETREREATGISTLKVRYNRVFGYYIEVTQAHLKSVPSHYQRKQTTVGAERFFTEELKKFEDEIVNASSRQRALESELFAKLVTDAQAFTRELMDLGRAVGELDSLCSLASLAGEPGWVFPEIDDSLALEIEAGRHPLVAAAAPGAFVPNDLSLSPETRLTLVITGPNMGGKSTIMRQTALIVILGQLGAPVPARKARWGAVSSLHTRIGAHDAIARGQSTFMVEMSELAHILHHADERSLIVLDEIGRGTSTYDGISVAWSALEWIVRQIRARTLFATHYHELTRLAAQLPGVANAHLGVEAGKTGDPAKPGESAARAGDLRFLYELREGPANESFGIHVARIAGLPRPVIERAWSVLEDLERQSVSDAAGDPPGQLSLFESRAAEPAPPPIHPLVTELELADINQMTPMQALNFVVKLQELSRKAAEN